jgi:hypothetical protein
VRFLVNPAFAGFLAGETMRTQDLVGVARTMMTEGRNDEYIEAATGLTLFDIVSIRATAAVAPPRPPPRARTAGQSAHEHRS